jgi:hypothetical protein
MTTGLYRRVALAVHDARTMTGAQIRDLFYDCHIVTLTNAVRNAISEGYISGPISYSMRLDAVFKARRAPAAKARTGPVPLMLADTPPVVQQRNYPAVRASRDDRPVPDRSHLLPQLMGDALYEDDDRHDEQGVVAHDQSSIPGLTRIAASQSSSSRRGYSTLAPILTHGGPLRLAAHRQFRRVAMPTRPRHRSTTSWGLRYSGGSGCMFRF